MFNLFKSKKTLTEQDSEFQVETYKWLLKNFGGDNFYSKSQIVLPTREYFPSKVESPEEAAIETFEAVKKYAGLEEWPCKLVAQEEDIDPLIAETVAIQNAPQSALGTFEHVGEGEVVITYNPSLLSNPAQLVATFAHELSHYLTGTANEPPPGGWDNWEFATDIAATFLGFGIFMANSAFCFSQYTGTGSQGWQSSRNGYLSEPEHVYSLAIFMLLKDISVPQVIGSLKPSLRKVLKKAIKEIQSTNTIQELTAVQYQEVSL